MVASGSTQWGPPLEPWMIEAVKTLGFDRMTPVQAATVPLLSGNKDVVVEAVTGSGKSLAFVLPTLIRLAKLDKLHMGQTNAIILSPTRELAQQIYRVFESVVGLAPERDKYKLQLVTGGSNTNITSDVKTYLARRPNVVVATPGRLLELLTSSHVKTNAVDLLVLDEADRLLDLGIGQTIKKIIGLLPKQKRVGLFSATMCGLVDDLVRVGMRNPVKVSVKSSRATPQTLSLEYVISSPEEKLPKALTLLCSTNYNKAIVYLPTCVSVSYWYDVLNLFINKELDQDIKIFSLHGKLQQPIRIKTLARFTDCLDKCILLATDVAARGLDIPDVDFVLQLDPPQDPDMFVHRAGRTARAGKAGASVVLLNDGLEAGYVDFMRVRKVPLVEKVVEVRDPKLTWSAYLKVLQAWVRGDRARHDLALRSFLSYVRFYMKHTASSIFRLASLNLVKLAESFGILRLPRMPELKDKMDVPEGGWLVDDFDMDAFKYVNAEQEKARLAKLETPKVPNPEAKAQKARNNQAWSAKLERKSDALSRREKRLKRAISKKEHTQADSSDSEIEQDWKELVHASKKRKPAPVSSAFDDL